MKKCVSLNYFALNSLTNSVKVISDLGENLFIKEINSSFLILMLFFSNNFEI